MNLASRWPYVVFVLLLVTMGGLMWRPLREESATADEPWVLTAGYAYDHGLGFRMDPEQPPLAKMWSALPLAFMGVKLSEPAAALINGRVTNPVARMWTGQWRPPDQLFSPGVDNWYYWPWQEANIAGQMVVYGGDNDAEKLLLAGRVMQVILSLLTGAAIFFWTRQLAGAPAAVLALAMWALNPIALAYGHLIQTDAGAALTILTSTWAFTRFQTRPDWRSAALAGLACGVALVTKLSALVLPAAFAVALVYSWWTQPPPTVRIRDYGRMLAAFLFSAWVVIMLVYAPCWSPAPKLTPEQAAALGVPSWFQTLRPMLVPRDFFKAVALLTNAATTSEHWGFLSGEWRTAGWWYYFPIAVLLKTPIPLLLLMLTGSILSLASVRRHPELMAPWIVGAVYLALAMTSTINLGIRHLLPVYALVAIGVATQIARARRAVRIGAWILCGWLGLVAVLAHPFYIEYFNEIAGGPKNGYCYLLDSNLDWGQDVKRLKQYLDQNHIQHVYLDYFGVQRAIEYYGISCTRVPSEQARQLHDGVLVVSAMELMRPEWKWLRQQHPPLARIGYTLFVYKLAG